MELDAQFHLCNDCYITTRERLLQDCLAYFLRYGVATLSLRPLAAAVGTSARMLLHYFGSKEALIAEVMDQVQLRLQRSFQEFFHSGGRAEGKESLLKFWRFLSSKPNRPPLRLLFEVQMLALQNPRRYRRYLRKTSTTWRHLIEQALPARQGGVLAATLYNAVVDGLLLELLSTGDVGRTSRALALFTESCARSIQR